MSKAYVIYYNDIPNNKIVALGTIHPNIKDAQKAMRISMTRIRSKYARKHDIDKNKMVIIDFSRRGFIRLLNTDGINYKSNDLYKYRIEELVLY